MHKNILYFIVFIFLPGCMDLCTPSKRLDGPYILLGNERGGRDINFDIDGENSIGRISNVDQIMVADDFILAKSDNRYYFIDRMKDHKFLNSAEIVVGPRDSNQFARLLDSLKIQELSWRKP